MREDDRFAPKAPPHWTAPEQPRSPSGVRSHPQDTPLKRFLGGFARRRLLAPSFRIPDRWRFPDVARHPALGHIRGLQQLVDRIWGLGFDAIREIADYILAGAAIVVPVWLVLRLMNMRNAR